MAVVGELLVRYFARCRNIARERHGKTRHNFPAGPARALRSPANSEPTPGAKTIAASSSSGGRSSSGASAISHDLYALVIKKGQVSEEQEIRVSKYATIVLGLIAIVLGILFEKQNVAFMVGLAFGIAAAANFPVLILSMYWRGLTTRGALAGGYSGLISAVMLVLLSKSVWVDVLGNAQPIFPYTQPALFAMPIAFLVTFIVSKLDTSAQAQSEIAAFEDQYVRGQTGYGAAAASNH